jgi:hypothetical protein
MRMRNDLGTLEHMHMRLLARVHMHTHARAHLALGLGEGFELRCFGCAELLYIYTHTQHLRPTRLTRPHQRREAAGPMRTCTVGVRAGVRARACVRKCMLLRLIGTRCASCSILYSRLHLEWARMSGRAHSSPHVTRALGARGHAVTWRRRRSRGSRVSAGSARSAWRT